MNLAAGVLGLLYALGHGGPALFQLNRPQTERGSHEPGAIPAWARMLWLLFALATAAGSIAYLVAATIAAAVVIAVGATGIWALAIANGFWIHGRPTVIHHVIRGSILAALMILTFLGLE